MKIVTPFAECIDEINPTDVLKKIERCGRVCYQSESKGEPEKFIRMLIKRGHESVLEHVSLTFHIICDRAIMAELTRHRLASFSVESTRYCKYDELTFIEPPFWQGDMDYWKLNCEKVESEYNIAVGFNTPPEIARAVLPLCLKTELFMTANLREWRHILKLRTSEKAHPQMRQVAGQILNFFKEKLPVFVEDI